MPEKEIRLELVLTLNGEFHLHHHHHHSDSQPGATELILTAIRDSKEVIMTQLDISAAKETSDLNALVTAVEALDTAFTNLQGQNNAALQAALDAANLDSATQASILDANDAAISAELAKVQALLTPPTSTGTAPGSAPGGAPGSAPGGAPGTDALTVTTTLPDGVVGTPYTSGLGITGGTAPYSVVLSGPASVNGLAMDASGNVSGTPTVAGAVGFAGTVADSASQTNAHATFTVSINVAEPVATA